jgi:hypothetical protein
VSVGSARQPTLSPLVVLHIYTIPYFVTESS